MEVIKYDGTRILTVEEIDSEFLDHAVLLDTDGFEGAYEGYLLASVKGRREAFEYLWDLQDEEYGGKGMVVIGCKTRGNSIGVYSQT
ncbi:MAG: hypothetical protein FWB74_02935 [Defluviitaleaceae bacterium]|nr:hypothetical protein [Defluviitaleaceae bacterium]